MKTQLIQSMGSFVLGTGVTLTVLASWLGTSDLQAIKDSVRNYKVEVEGQASALATDYQVTVDSANAEIGEYKDALEQANSNISQLITAYENAEEEHRKEILLLESRHDGELQDLQTELEVMQRRMNAKYETDMNAVIEQANEQINQANQEVAETKEQVLEDLQTSQVDEIVERAEQLKDQLDTGNDKSVHDISSIVPSEQPQE